MDFEERLKRLQDISGQLEKGEISLEAGLELYKEGMTLAAACRAELEKAAHTVRLHSSEGWREFSLEGPGADRLEGGNGL